jgi:hypothetical protein
MRFARLEDTLLKVLERHTLGQFFLAEPFLYLFIGLPTGQPPALYAEKVSLFANM